MKIKKSLNLLIILALICSIFGFSTQVKAETGSGRFGFGGNSTVSLGSNITITLYVTDIKDVISGITSIEANLSFDSQYLEYVSGTGMTDPYKARINTSANYKIAALDTDLIGFNTQTTIMTFVFKALREGETEVTVTGTKLTDKKNQLTSTVTPKKITIGPKSTPTPTPTPTQKPTPTPTPTPTPSTPPSKSSDATLKTLVASGYTLSPSFSADTTNYTVKVPSDATNVILQGTANHGKATIAGLGTINLTGDSTTATVTVTAEDGSKKTYTILIEKENRQEVPKDGNANLKSLSVSGYTLSPTFKSNVNTYSMSVKNNVTGLDVSAIPASDKASVVVTGNKGWKVGVNVVTIKVTAEDGSQNTYIINVTRASSTPKETAAAKSTDNYLKSLIINSSHEITPAFDKNKSNYTVTVPYEVDKLDLTYLTNHSNAKVKVNGNSNFKVGEVNTVEIEVTAEDGTVRIYTLNVTRSTQTGKTDLKELTVTNGVLSPNFDPNVLEYNVKVDGKIDQLDIRAIAKDPDSKVEIIGNSNLKEGKNTVLVKVTDKNGFTKYYTINVEKETKKNTILGLSPLQFGIITGIISLLLLLLLFLLFKKRKKDDETSVASIAPQPPVTPIIEVKPEFNFGSKNSSDDDVVHGNFNQNSTITGTNSLPEPKAIEAIEASYEELEENVPYDPYDETVTKREIIDAINEATRTKDPAKLKMLLEQDALNQKKKELKRKEAELRNRKY